MSSLVQLINDFNQSGIKYSVFKEFDLISKTITGKEDIDILISDSDINIADIIMRNNGYRKCKWPKPLFGISFYLGYDEENDCMSLLHIHTRLRIGTKAYKEYRWKDMESYILNNYDDSNIYNCRTISKSEEICLLFIRMILRKKPNDDDYARLRELSNLVDINNVPFSNVLCSMIKKDSISIYSYINSNDFGDDDERKSIREYLYKGDGLAVNVRVAWGFIHRIIMFLRRRTNTPYRPIRNFGKIYAVVGVDGCGKSTMLDLLLHNQVMKLIGIKRIYGGNNEYWIPKLQKAVDSLNKRYKIIGILRIIDKRLRILGAFYYSLRGFNVIFDRYYYDDMVTYSVSKNKMSILNKVKNMFLNHLGFVPYRTFLLDIDAEGAYKRKQDYEFELLEKYVDAYRDVVGKRKETLIIDSTNEAKKNLAKIIRVIFSE